MSELNAHEKSYLRDYIAEKDILIHHEVTEHQVVAVG